MRKRIVVISAGAVVFVVLIAIAVVHLVTTTPTGVVLFSDVIPTSQLTANLKNHDDNIKRESLAVLTWRKDPGARTAALPLLENADAYVWLNAALYLGSIGEPAAVPYLIKGLRHYAWRVYPECAADLKAITGLTFGTNFNAWHDWWMSAHPGSTFNFDDNLGR